MESSDKKYQPTHGVITAADVDIDDMIKKTLRSCSDIYYNLETCLVDNNRDWRKCQSIVKELKLCNDALNKKNTGVTVDAADSIDTVNTTTTTTATPTATPTATAIAADNFNSKGILEFNTLVNVDEILMHSDVLPLSDTCSNDVPVAVENISCIVCLLIIPSFLIPRDILTYFSSYLTSIDTMQILRHYCDPERYFGLIKLDTPASASKLIDDFHGQLLTSLEPTLCFLYSVRDVRIGKQCNALNRLVYDRINSNSNSGMVKGSYGSIMGSIDSDSIELSALQVNGMDDSNSGRTGIEYDSLLSSIATDFIDTKVRASSISLIPAFDRYSPTATANMSPSLDGNNNSHVMNDHFDDDITSCAVCLEVINVHKPLSFTTCCNHIFHIQCVLRLEGPQCPVCRFQHDSIASITSECVVCHWPNSSNNGYNDNSVGSNDSIIPDTGNSSGQCDLWLCLVCGFIGCGRVNGNHIRGHYEQHLHTYAMNLESRQVYDFAGDGYVHRLILQQASSPGAIHSTTSHAFNSEDYTPEQTKVVEVSVPGGQSSLSRSSIVPLSQDDEEYIINRKLEYVALNYNQLVTWQLEQCREQHQLHLARLRNFLQQEIFSNVSTDVTHANSNTSSSTSNSTSRSGNWKNKVTQLLNMELHKVNQQHDSLALKLKSIKAEADTLNELNRSLVMNRKEWGSRLNATEVSFVRTKENYDTWIKTLENKVNDIMSNLN